MCTGLLELPEDTAAPPPSPPFEPGGRPKKTPANCNQERREEDSFDSIPVDLWGPVCPTKKATLGKKHGWVRASIDIRKIRNGKKKRRKKLP